jgi:hypothetical protein
MFQVIYIEKIHDAIEHKPYAKELHLILDTDYCV